ncbi:MAG: hypothetical protein IJD45_03285 [Clostridia bacterium]|nr:hypothetical protein [Clostridia bacterium]
MKKVIAFLITAALILTLCGCDKNSMATNKKPSDNNGTETLEYKGSITLLYSKADTFNPYTAKTEVNRQLCKLLYEPLVKTDDDFEPHNCIAKSVKISKDICTVVLKSVKFSDGTKLTADDVVYSYKLAKKSKTSYKNKLYMVESVSVKDSNTVVFTLKKQDPYFANVLDFPVIKSGSDKKTDSDSVKFPPVGAGRYKLNKDNTVLTLNEHYFAKKSSIKKINLINSPDMESITHYIEIGATDIYFTDISDGEIPRMSGTKTNINLNNLVYIGVNHANKKLALENLRQAISSGIDRSEITKNAYFNNAMSCTGFFNPLWDDTKSLQNIQITANSQITVENLEEIGYNKLDSDGVRRNGNSPLSFSLLVNKENSARVAAAKLIASQLKKQGIKITVVKTSFKEYKRRLKNGEFDLYLGEVKITENMDFSEMVLAGGSAAYGIKAQAKKDTEKEEEVKGGTENQKKKKSKTLTCAKVIKNFYKGKNSISDVAVTLQNDMPFIPVCYRTGVLFCNENIENLNMASLSDIYFSIDSYKIKKN